jgi:N-acetylmuramoyl-L-alanine amidase
MRRSGRTAIHKVLALCLGLVAAAFATPIVVLAARPVTIKEVRLWAGPDGTRLVFDLSEPVEHSVLTLDNPDRVVVDIPGAVIDSSRVLPEGQGFVKQLRAAEQPNGDLRVVVDLSSPAEPRTFSVGPQQSYGHRLVMDLTPSSKTAAVTPAPLSVVKAAADAHGRDIVVAIDAGHGGVDPGSIGKRGTYEKHVTLAIARRLKERIDREPGMRAILTRDNDTFVELRDRIVRARRQQADMFVSIHADSYTNRSVAGSSVYVLSARGASDESARWLADRENAADLIGGVKLDDKDNVLASVLLDLSQSASMSASVDAADKVMQELYKIGNITNRGVKHAGFVVLKSPDIPSMLVETAFISNPTEEARLLDAKHQQRLAEAIHQGVRGYFYANPPPGTLIAELRAKSSGPTVVASTAEGEKAAGTSN